MIFMENGTIRFVPNNIKMIKLFHYNALVFAIFQRRGGETYF